MRFAWADEQTGLGSIFLLVLFDEPSSWQLEPFRYIC